MLKRFAIIALLCVPFLCAKDYTFTLANKTQVGSAQLKPGEYTVSVKGTQATITDYYGHRTQTPVKVEANDSAYPETSVVCTTTNGVDRIEYIGLKGSKDKVVLNQ